MGGWWLLAPEMEKKNWRFDTHMVHIQWGADKAGAVVLLFMFIARGDTRTNQFKRHRLLAESN